MSEDKHGRTYAQRIDYTTSLQRIAEYPNPYLGSSELADVLGITRQAVTSRAKPSRTAELPPIAFELVSANLWEKDSVRRWLEDRKLSSDGRISGVVPVEGAVTGSFQGAPAAERSRSTGVRLPWITNQAPPISVPGNYLVWVSDLGGARPSFIATMHVTKTAVGTMIIVDGDFYSDFRTVAEIKAWCVAPAGPEECTAFMSAANAVRHILDTLDQEGGNGNG